MLVSTYGFWLSLHGAFRPDPSTTIISGAASGRPPHVISFFGGADLEAVLPALLNDLAAGLAAAGAAAEVDVDAYGDLNLERAFKAVFY